MNILPVYNWLSVVPEPNLNVNTRDGQINLRQVFRKGAALIAKKMSGRMKMKISKCRTGVADDEWCEVSRD